MTLPVYLLCFVSGFVALVYEVLWLRQLALLFGSTAYAAATTLAVFFAGLSLGSHVWGRRAAQYRSPLRVYAALEVGIAICALAHFVSLNASYALYAPLFRTQSEQNQSPNGGTVC